MMPLPQLLDGLGRGRLDVVQKAFILHHKAFKLEFLKHLIGGASASAEEHVARMAVLFETILNHSKKSDHNSVFAQSLINASIDHIKELLQLLNRIKLPTNHSSIQQKKAVLEMLNFHLYHLESLIKREPRTQETLSAPGKIVTIAHVHSSSVSDVLWNKLSSKSDEALVRHALLSADAVDCAQRILLSRGKHNPAQINEFFQSVADAYVHELLLQRQIDTAKDVIRNSDREIWSTLKAMCKDTTESAIRDYLMLELKAVSLLEPMEIDAWKFLLQIHGIIKNTNLGIKIVDGNLKTVKPFDGENQLEVSISSLLKLPESARVSFLTALYFETLNSTLEPMLNKDECWRFLLSSDQLEIIIKWVHAVCSKSDSPVKPDQVTIFLSDWGITQEMIDYTSEVASSPATRDCVLDCLSRFGLHSSDESSNVHKLIFQALRTSQIFNGMDENTEKLFIELCVQCNLPDLLVSCNVKSGCQTLPWLQLYSTYQTIKSYPSVKRSLLICVENSADYLKIPKSGNQWISLAPFLLADQASHETNIDFEEEEGRVRQEILTHYPQLASLLTSKTHGIKPIDVSVHSLLKEKFASASSHHVLKKQSLCSMFKEESGECEIDFSHEPSVLLHGHHETLGFQYFLKQGRPCHAVMLLLSEVIRNFGKPSRKLLKRAVISAHELAFQNTTDPAITTSCIAFVEMLGETSLTLRTHLATVNQITSCNLDLRRNSYELLQQLLVAGPGETPNAQEVFELLLCTLPFNMHMQGLAVQFANLHKLPLHTDFLEHCARNNDWISFLLFCHIYNYPPDIVKRAIQEFRSTALVEHLEAFLQRYVPPMKTAIKSNSETSWHRITPQSSACEASCSKDLDVASASEGPPLLVSGAKNSLFEVLLVSHNCADPVEALLHACVAWPCPVLAVIAGFYQAKTEAQLVSWLASWLPPEERLNFGGLHKNAAWPSGATEFIVLRSFELSQVHLLTGFEIFTPDHPLVLLLKVLEKFSTRELHQNVQYLNAFKESSMKLENVTINLQDSCCLKNASFVFNLGSKILLKYLQNLQSTNEKKYFLQILCEANISFSPEGFSVDQSKKLLAILSVLSSTEVHIDVNSFFKDCTEEIRRISRNLISKGLYKEAACISDDTFVIFEQTDKLKKYLNANPQDFKTFCSDCNTCFKQAVVDPLSAFNFFRVSALDLKGNTNRWRALYNAFKWLSSVSSNETEINLPAQLSKLEIEMWKCCFQDNDLTIFNSLAEELQHSGLSTLCTDKLAIKSFSFTEVFHQCDRLCEEKSCVQKLIDCLLDIGDIVSASRVLYLFESNHQDLEVLQTCVCLAEEKLKIQEIPTHWVLFPTLKLPDASSTEPSVSSFSGQGKVSSTSQENSEFMQKTSVEKLKSLSVVQELCKQLKHGKDIGKQLIAGYRLAINLGLSYEDIVAITDPLKLLRTAMSQSYCTDHSIASDVMTAFRMSPAERAKFLSREIIAAISKGPAPGNVKVYHMWNHDIEQYFSHILELVPDPALLGDEIMHMVGNLAISDKDTPKPVVSTAVELLVRAHDCYAAGCHMEGISLVLRTVSSFTPTLKERAEWALMVRLLTGIQRYTEMNYIFKVLKDSDQFEFLLRKNSVKPLGYKLALLDWLRRDCTHDVGMLKMTTAHFQMHQQEAGLWRKEGDDRLSALVKMSLSNNQKTKQGLQTALQDYSHASECYLQADMVNHAMTCAHQAELVALQLHLLSSNSEGSVLQVVMLDLKSVAKLIASTLSFHQAVIVARAYNHRTDWAAALFYHCISPGLSTEEYFSAWSSCMELTPLLAQNIAYRLQRTVGTTREMMSKMQWLLGHVKDMDVRYKIASELGLKDMVESLLHAPEIAYLKDTVWQSGFKR